MFFTNLVSFMSAGAVVALVLAKKDAIQEWRKLMGPTNPAEAKETFPDSIRALFGKGTLTTEKNIISIRIEDNTRNAVHGSDSVLSSQREISFFFPQMILTGDTASSEYLEQHVMPTLNASLTQLAKEKPERPLLWLATYLEKNNPNKPDVEFV